MTEYYIPTSPSQIEWVEKRSRFLGQVCGVEREEDVKEKLEEIRRQYHDARHHCWCYILQNGIQRYSDDGEPQGTAGQPMLQVIQRAGLVNTLCVVTRYFGGILLGTGGLVRAYTRSAQEAVKQAGISVVRPWDQLSLACTYRQYERIKGECQQMGGVIAQVDYSGQVTLTLLLPQGTCQSYLEHIQELSGGTVEVLSQGVQWRASPC